MCQNENHIPLLQVHVSTGAVEWSAAVLRMRILLWPISSLHLLSDQRVATTRPWPRAPFNRETRGGPMTHGIFRESVRNIFAAPTSLLPSRRKCLCPPRPGWASGRAARRTQERKAPATDFHTKKMFEIRISAIWDPPFRQCMRRRRRSSSGGPFSPLSSRLSARSDSTSKIMAGERGMAHLHSDQQVFNVIAAERERSCPLNYLDLLLYLSAIHRLVVSGKSFIKSCFISAPYITHKHFIWFLVIFKFVWSPKDVSHHDFGIKCDKIQSPHKSEQHSFPGQCLRNLFLSSSIFVFLSTTCRLYNIFNKSLWISIFSSVYFWKIWKRQLMLLSSCGEIEDL